MEYYHAGNIEINKMNINWKITLQLRVCNQESAVWDN